MVFVELARIGRRWMEAVNTIRQLRGEGVRFRSLAEGESTWAWYLEADEEADEDSPDRFVGELLLQVAAWAAAQELEAIRRHTKAGLAGARPKGRRWADRWRLRDQWLSLAASKPKTSRLRSSYTVIPGLMIGASVSRIKVLTSFPGLASCNTFLHAL